MGTVFFTSDLHFFHRNIIDHCNRPFAHADEMNHALVGNWNAKVGADDTIYCLGDLLWAGHTDTDAAKDLLASLNGRIVLILGNHDHESLDHYRGKAFNPIAHRCSEITEYKKISVDRHPNIVLFHYPIEYWDKCHKGSIHLHGHLHGRSASPDRRQRRLDVGVDAWNYAPVGLDEVLELLKNRPEKGLSERSQGG